MPDAAHALLSVCIPDGPLRVWRIDMDITSSCRSFWRPNATAPDETISIWRPDCWSSATWNQSYAKTSLLETEGAVKHGQVYLLHNRGQSSQCKSTLIFPRNHCTAQF